MRGTVAFVVCSTFFIMFSSSFSKTEVNLSLSHCVSMSLSLSPRPGVSTGRSGVSRSLGSENKHLSSLLRFTSFFPSLVIVSPVGLLLPLRYMLRKKCPGSVRAEEQS